MLNVALFAAAFVATSILGTMVVAEPYELRGIRLGIQLSQFRQLHSPDERQTRVWCRGEQPDLDSIDLALLPGDDAAGVVPCRFFRWEVNAQSPGRWTPAGLLVAGIRAFPTFKFVRDDASGALRLWRIEVRSHVSDWLGLFQGLTAKYGKPSTSRQEVVQNQFGAKFDSAVTIWKNADSSITLIQRFASVMHTYLWYEHEQLRAIKEKRDGTSPEARRKTL